MELQIVTAAKILLDGGVVAFPTETVYGLGACLFNEKAIGKVFELKGRPSDNPLIIHIANLDDLDRLANKVPEEARLLAKAFWPGPLSMILEASSQVPSIARAGLPTVAIRMPSHPLALALIEEVGQPLVAPSANLSGRPSGTKAEHVLHDFGKKVPVLDGGSCEKGLESTVIDLRVPKTPKVLRPGAISRAMLENVLGCPVELGNEAICPGTKYRHYAPNAKVTLFYDRSLPPQKGRTLMRQDGTLSEESYYDALRQADLDGVKEIFIFCDKATIENEGFYNRILKSSL